MTGRPNTGKRRRKSRGGRIDLSFRLIQCRCGIKREVGVQCADCGQRPDPREVDVQRQRRQAAATAALRALTPTGDQRPVGCSVPEIANNLVEFLPNWLNCCWQRLDDAAANPGALVAHARALAETRERLDAVPRSRPWISLLASLQTLLQQADDTFRQYAAVISAPSAGEAQRQAEAGQQSLDVLGEQASHPRDILDFSQRLDEATNPTEVLTALTGMVVTVAESAQILEVDQRGGDLFTDIVGPGKDCPPGLGVLLLTLDTSVFVMGDRARYRDVARRAARMLLDTPRGRALVRNPTWRRDMNDAAVSAYDSSAAALAVLSAVNSERVAADTVMELAHSLVEAGGRPHAATMEHVAGRSTYEQVKSHDAASVLRALLGRPNSDMLLGLSPELRNAKAHRQYGLEGGGLVILDGQGVRRRSYAPDELADSVLAGQESVAALTAGFICAAAALGEHSDDLLPSAAALPWRESAAMLAVLQGWADVTFDEGETPGQILVRGTPSLDSASARTALLVSLYLPTTATHLLAVSSDRKTRLALPLAPVRAWSDETNDYLKQVLLVRALRCTRINGRACMERDQFRRCVANMALITMDEEFAERMQRLRVLYESAAQDLDEELAGAVRGLMAAGRADATGTVRTREEQGLVERLVTFSELKAEDLLS